MFDIGASELLVIAIVAIIVIGPKELPLAMRTAGRWIAKVRRVSAHFRTGLDAMVREAELEEMDKEWKAKNARIMAEHPPKEKQSGGEAKGEADEMEPLPQVKAEAAAIKQVEDKLPTEETSTTEQPKLPLDKPAAGD